MRCLYCGKGIGPFRLLKDREFCTPTHRSEYNERFRQQLHDVLAPEPPPADIAGFRQQPGTSVADRVLRARACDLPMIACSARRPWFAVRPASGAGGPAGWVLATTLPAASTPRLSLEAAPLPQILSVPFQAEALSAGNGTASAVLTSIRPEEMGTRPLVTAPPFPAAHGPLCDPVPVPALTWKPAPVQAYLAAAQPQGSLCSPHRPVLFGDRAPYRPALADANGATLAAFRQPALAVAGALPYQGCTAGDKGFPVAIETPGPRSAEAVLPLPQAAAAARGMAVEAHFAIAELEPAVAAVVPAQMDAMRAARGVAVALPDIGHTLPAEPPAVCTPQAAELVRPALSPHAAAPRAALPCWDARPAALGMTAAAEPRSLASLLLRTELPSPPPALDAPAAMPLPAVQAGRLAPGYTARWERRARALSAAFSLHPIRARFPELLRGKSILYAGEHDELKSNVRQMRRPRRALRASTPRWQYAGALAAALLLAGVLAPRTPFLGIAKTFSRSSGEFRGALAERATLRLAENFHAGLQAWKGADLASLKTWSHNLDGYMRPGQLALYKPSLPLSDYRLEFLAQVESKSVDWVVRARDPNNYYAVKFTVLQPGPRPLVAMVRYPVIDGHKGTRVQVPVRTMIHANTAYRVTVDVKGDQYRAYIEGEQADYWTENRLKTGGVGFFSEAGEHARVYWVKLESHGDFIGRVCGMLTGKSGQPATQMEKQAMDYRHSGITELDPAPGSGGTELADDTAQDARISRVLSKAASLHLENKRDEAVLELRRAIEDGERHPALYFALGQLQYELQDYEPAAQSYAQAAMLQPLHPTAHFNTGVCLGRLERWEEAAEFFHVALANDPARMEAHLALGACLVHAGRHNEALDSYDRFLARYPDHEEALFGKAVALQKRDRQTEAAELYRRVLARNPRSEEALTNLVSVCLENQDHEQARKYAERLAEVQPRSQVALEGLAAAAFAAGDHAAATAYSRKLAELAPQVFENWFNLGVACHKAGDLGSAAEAYGRAARVQPESAQAHLNLGVSLHETGDLKGARSAYDRALEIDPNLPGVHWNLGLVHEQSGDPAAAEQFYARVPANSPDADDAAFRIGHLRLQRGDFPGSIETFQACLQKRPDWPEARLNLGIAHWRSGDKEAARACFQELSASGTESKEALRGLAALALERQEFDKAFEIYRQLIDTGERSPELLYNAALICQKKGQPEDAAVLYREALKVDPQFGEALLNLGHALMALGDEFEARSCWRKAVIAKPELAQHYFEPAAAV